MSRVYTVFNNVGNSGDVIDTSLRKVVAYAPSLSNSRIYCEIDWQNGTPVLTTNRYGEGYKAVTGDKDVSVAGSANIIQQYLSAAACRNIDTPCACTPRRRQKVVPWSL